MSFVKGNWLQCDWPIGKRGLYNADVRIRVLPVTLFNEQLEDNAPNVILGTYRAKCIISNNTIVIIIIITRFSKREVSQEHNCSIIAELTAFDKKYLINSQNTINRLT
jgi:hypothetical protein